MEGGTCESIWDRWPLPEFVEHQREIPFDASLSFLFVNRESNRIQQALNLFFPLEDDVLLRGREGRGEMKVEVTEKKTLDRGKERFNGRVMIDNLIIRSMKIRLRFINSNPNYSWSSFNLSELGRW